MSFPEWDRNLFVYLNSKNMPWLDSTMVFLSSHLVWAFICLLLVLFMMWQNREKGRRASLYLVGGVIATLLLNNGIKLCIMRPRPGHEESLKELIYQLEELGKSYSFFSAHSSSSMCLATFTALYFKNKIYGIAIYVWASFVAYSRIYVGKHYPLDVFVGIFFGLFMGWLSFWFYTRYMQKHAYPH